MRSREEIESFSWAELGEDRYGKRILEVLLDIRDLLNKDKLNEKESK